MSSAAELAGLGRLMDVARRHGVPVETLPPSRFPPRAGDKLYGMPIDPMLAAAFSRFGKLILDRLGRDTCLLTPGTDEKNGLVLENEEWQSLFPHRFWPDHFRALMLFGGQMRYRYATVPELAGSEGFQPVVFLDPYEEIHALPIASNVDRFFDTFSRYMEVMTQDPGYQAGGISEVGFPYGVSELIATDEPLIGMIKEGRFDRLMYERAKTGWRDERGLASTREWVGRLLR